MCRKYLDFPIVTDRVSKATLTNSDNFSYLSVRDVFRDIWNLSFHEKKISSKNIYKLFREVEI